MRNNNIWAKWVVWLLSVLGVGTQAVAWYSMGFVEIDGITYSPVSSNAYPKTPDTVFVYSFSDDLSDAVIRSNIEYQGKNFPVTEIWLEAKDFANLRKVTIPASVTCIAKTGFSLTGLEEVRILGNIVSGYGCFSNSLNLTTAVLGNNVTQIGAGLFAGCTMLKSMTIPIGTTTIGRQAFSNCTSLTSITIPGSVTDIGNGAFGDCNGLTNVTIGAGVMSIGNRMFSRCNGLRSVTIPSSVTSLGSNAFYNCSGLARVTIQGNITNDWDYFARPFANCMNIESIVLGEKMTKIGDYMFYNCPQVQSLTIPDSVTSIGDMAFADCSGLASVTIPNSVTSIGNGTFHKCSGLASVTIGNSVTSIGVWSFADCSGLTRVTVPDSVTRIGNGTFHNCSALASVTIGNSVASIGGETFSGCSALTSVTIPDNVAGIGNFAFYNCSSLARVTIQGNITNDWDCSARPFGNCTNIESIVLGEKMMKIGDYMFYNCPQVQSLTIPDNVSSIGTGAFEGCSGLTSVTFEGTPPSVNEVYYGEGGYSAPFYNVGPRARGYYKAEHATEWETVIVDGKWAGLIMKMMGPELRVQSANPSEGSLTLAWNETATVEGVTYSVYRSANDTYSAADLVTNGLTATTWTDTTYWSAEPVLKPLNYWVVADGGGYGERMSNPVETRHRYGISVGIGKYAWYNLSLSDNFGMAMDATLCRALAEEHGNFSSFTRIVDEDAILSNVQKHMKMMSAKAQPGDVFFLFVSAHGAEGQLHLYGWSDYTTALLREDITAFNPGVAIIGVVMACHSGSILKLENWPTNAAWICSCSSAQETLIYGEGSLRPSPFGEILLQDGWAKGYADEALFGTRWTGGDADGIVTFGELAKYGKEFLKGYSDIISPSSLQISNTNLLELIAAGRVGAKAMPKRPDTPESCQASYGTSDKGIGIHWACPSDSSIRRYWLFRQGPGEIDPTCISRYANDGRFTDPWTIERTGLLGIMDKFLHTLAPKRFQEYRYFVQAVSPSGISEPSPMAIGMSGTPQLKEWLEGFGYLTEAQITSADTAIAANGVNTVFDSYVLGLNPTDSTSRFEMRLYFKDGKPIPTWVPDLNKGGTKEERVYRVEAKKEMSDEFWTDVTTVEDLEAEGWHFFRVGVELAE